MEMIGTYNIWFVGLSIFIAVLASYTALDLGGRVFHSFGWRRKGWLLCGSVTMGIGIWSMHFVGMLALQLPMPMDYDSFIVFLSILAACLGSFLVFGTVTNRRMTAQSVRLKRNEQRYRSLVDHNKDAIFTINTQGQFLTMNQAGTRMTGIPEKDWHLLQITELCSDEEARKCMHYLHQVLLHQKTVSFNSSLNKLTQPIDLAVTLMPIYIEGNLDGVYGIGQDITARLKAEKEIHHMAFFDQLTGLPNRRQFIDRLNQCLEGQERCAVCFLDLNRFKIINDALGHSTGDLLLKHAAERLLSCIGNHDLVARLGGDEFTIIISDIESPDESTYLAKRVIEAFETPFLIQNHELRTSVSIGIAMVPKDGNSADVIMKHADMAMYASKHQSKSKYCYYSAAFGERSEGQLMREQELREGIEHNEFYLEYQPQIDASSNGLAGVEALARWKRPNGEIRQPESFIPLAEETGLIIPLGNKILELAVMQTKEWSDRDFQLRVAVNLSPRQFQSENIVQTLSELLEQYQLGPEWIELEITESMMMENMERSIFILNAFRKLGVSLSIDDFGTAHSSLRYLKDFPVQRLKIDRSFVKEISANPRSTQITSAIIAMGQHLDLDTIAEGVETEEQLSFLCQQKCSYLQGIYFSHPISKEDIEKNYFQTKTPAFQ